MITGTQSNVIPELQLELHKSTTRFPKNFTLSGISTGGSCCAKTVGALKALSACDSKTLDI